jgi:hypothetical protein
MAEFVEQRMEEMIPEVIASIFFFFKCISCLKLNVLHQRCMNVSFLLTCLLGFELPVVPLGPLGECLPHPHVVLHPSIFPPNLFPSREEQPARCAFCNFS